MVLAIGSVLAESWWGAASEYLYGGRVNSGRAVPRAMGVVPAVFVEGPSEAIEDYATAFGIAAASGACLVGVREGMPEVLGVRERGCLGEGGCL